MSLCKKLFFIYSMGLFLPLNFTASAKNFSIQDSASKRPTILKEKNNQIQELLEEKESLEEELFRFMATYDYGKAEHYAARGLEKLKKPLKNKVQKLEIQLNRLKDTCHKHKNHSQKLKDKIISLNFQLKELEGSISQRIMKVKKPLIKQKETLENQISVLRKELETIKNTIKEKEAFIEKISRQRDVIDGRLVKALEQGAILERKIIDLKFQLKQKDDSISLQISRAKEPLERNIIRLQGELRQIKQEMALNVEQGKKPLKEKINFLTAKLKQNEKNTVQKEKLIEKITAKKEMVEQKFTRVTKEKLELENTLTDLRNEIKGMKAVMNEAITTAQVPLENKIGVLEEKIKVLQKTVKIKEMVVQELIREKRALARDLIKFDSAKKSAEEQSASAMLKLQLTEESVNDKIGQAKNFLEKKIKNLENDIHLLKGTLQEKETVIKYLQDIPKTDTKEPQ